MALSSEIVPIHINEGRQQHVIPDQTSLISTDYPFVIFCSWRGMFSDYPSVVLTTLLADCVIRVITDHLPLPRYPIR